MLLGINPSRVMIVIKYFKICICHINFILKDTIYITKYIYSYERYAPYHIIFQKKESILYSNHATFSVSVSTLFFSSAAAAIVVVFVVSVVSATAVVAAAELAPSSLICLVF